MKKRTKCHLYTKVSTSIQVDGYSLDAQKDKLRKYAEYEDMTIVGEYSDEGFSDKNIQGRLEFQRMHFYALRPLLAARYIEAYHMAPPVLFEELLKMEMPQELRDAIGELLERKKRTTEGEGNPQIPVIRSFIESETVRQKEIADNLPDDHNKDWTALNRVLS